MIRRFLNICLAALREIFDEAAYGRFLVRQGRPHGRESYLEFQREHYAAKARRVKCC